MTGTIVAPAGSWSCVSHHQSPVFISLYILRLSESARHAGSKSRSAWNGRCAKRNCIHLKISLWYNVPNMCEWSSIQLSLPSPELSLEWSIRRASADCNDSMLKLSSPRRRCWSIHIFVCWLNDWACWKWCADWKGCHGFHCSEYLRCLLYNPVALPYAFPPPRSPLQLPAYEPSSLLDQGDKSDQVSGGQSFLRREYLQVVVLPVHCLWVDELVD